MSRVLPLNVAAISLSLALLAGCTPIDPNKPDAPDLDICNAMVDAVGKQKCIDAAYAERKKRMDADKKPAERS